MACWHVQNSQGRDQACADQWVTLTSPHTPIGLSKGRGLGTREQRGSGPGTVDTMRHQRGDSHRKHPGEQVHRVSGSCQEWPEEDFLDLLANDPNTLAQSRWKKNP